MAENFVTKDGGDRVSYSGGMVRDTTEGKVDYSLGLDGPLVSVFLDGSRVGYAFARWYNSPLIEHAVSVVIALSLNERGLRDLFGRYVALMERGASKYSKRNWMLANGLVELARFRESAVRHMVQYLDGDRSEDHAAAVVFNLNGFAYASNVISSRANERKKGADDLPEAGLMRGAE